MAERPGEVLTDRLSGSADGRPIRIGSTTQTLADEIHNITSQDVVDAVWIECHNNTSATVDVTFNVCPADDANAAACTASEMVFSIPRYATVQIMSGHRVRATGQNYVVGAYVGVGDDNKLTVIGHCVRRFQTDITF
tara:strand:+ start:661 stop:1071 length:411 start_codon:yes stop_codon:yes gene_type:complete